MSARPAKPNKDWLVYFEDRDVPRYVKLVDNWACHLFVRVSGNGPGATTALDTALAALNSIARTSRDEGARETADRALAEIEGMIGTREAVK